MRPNQTNIAKWIIALRSGKYEQTNGYLRDKTGYCCLGVACEISKLGKWKSAVENGAFRYEPKKGIDSATVLPPKVIGWLGITYDNPRLDEGDFANTPLNAITANDQHGFSFDKIADKLESYYLNGKKAEIIVKHAKAREAKRRASA